MHRFMLDCITRPDDAGVLPEGVWFIPGRTAYEGIWFTHGPVAIWDFGNSIQTFSSMAEVQNAYPKLELRWLDNDDEYWDEKDLAVRSSLRNWTWDGPELTLSPVINNVN